jgi:putative SOS response-associated peptidase YedK
MCSRYYRFKDLKDLVLRFKIAQVLSVLGPQYNIAPTDRAVVVIAADKDHIARDMIFGIPNPWIKVKPSLLMNMRAESFVNKPHFRKYLLNQRCLVVADGFIEWEREEDGKKKKTSIPYRIDPRNHETVGLAGIYDQEGFVIITTEPSGVVKEIHDLICTN